MTITLDICAENCGKLAFKTFLGHGRLPLFFEVLKQRNSICGLFEGAQK
jgi:hypothetical protein